MEEAILDFSIYSISAHLVYRMLTLHVQNFVLMFQAGEETLGGNKIQYS